MKSCDLRLAHRIVIDFKDINLVLLVDPILVDPDNDVFTAINTGLFLCCGLFNSEFWQACFNCFRHASGCFHFSD